MKTTVVTACLLAGNLLVTLRQGCLAETSPAWSGATVKITDLLQPYTNHGQYALAQASVMTSNGCHVAKVEGSRAEGYFVRRDGKPGRRYAQVGVPVFSADGTCLAYVAGKEETKVVVVNEQEDPGFRRIPAETLALSYDGKRHAYIAWQDGGWVLVIDGQVQPTDKLAPLMNSKPVFSPDGSKVAYVTRGQQTLALSDRPASKLCIVVNGKAVGLHDDVDERFLTFSADSVHFAYAAGEGGRWFRVIDGTRGPPFDALGIDFVFSYDGERTAFTGRNGRERFLVVDGKVVTKIEGIVDGTLAFSPDGKRLAYAVSKTDKSAYIVVDGQAGPVYDSIVGGSILPGTTASQASGLYAAGALTYHPGVLFSPDSRKVAYVALKGDKSFLVINETKGTDYDLIGHFGFSRDGNHIAFTAKKGDKMVIVVDGKERAAYASVPAGPVFRSDGALEFLAVDKTSLYRIEVTDF